MKSFLMMFVLSLTIVSYAAEDAADVQKSRARFEELTYTVLEKCLKNNQVKATCDLYLQFGIKDKDTADLLASFGAYDDCINNGSKEDKRAAKAVALSAALEGPMRHLLVQDAMRASDSF